MCMKIYLNSNKLHYAMDVLSELKEPSQGVYLHYKISIVLKKPL